jgi:hypothetical protein
MGIRFVNTLARTTPICLITIVNKINAIDEGNIDRSTKIVYGSMVIGNSIKCLRSQTIKNGRNNNPPINV